MSKPVTLWGLASVITVSTAVYQRLTGPTYPVSGTTWFEGVLITYRFDRNHGGTSGAPVNISTDEPDISGTVLWKRFRSPDDWQMLVMSREQDELTAILPPLPPAGKILYQIRLERNDAVMLLPPEPVVIRYKGEVPLWVLIPHVMVMFGAMLASTRTGLEYFRDRPSYTVLIRWTLGLLFAGGLILGPPSCSSTRLRLGGRVGRTALISPIIKLQLPSLSGWGRLWRSGDRKNQGAGSLLHPL